MKLYVAGRTGNIDHVHVIQSAVMDHGHEITHDWTDPELGEVRDDWSDAPERARQVATLDFLGVANSDGVILCGYGCEEDNKGGLGCFIEVGIALASSVPVIVLGPARESVFWYSPFTLKVYKDEPLEMESDAHLEERIKLETAVALSGLESLRRQQRLALSDTDIQAKL